ncbi:hypothetical protein BGZ83_011298, partial [Gryganskiella cystojenkinii]
TDLVSPSARPQRSSRRTAAPTTSFSQMTLHDNSSSSTLPRMTSSDQVLLDSSESKRPMNRRSNRDFRIIPSTETEVMDQFAIKDSIRHSHQTLHENSSTSSIAPEVGQRSSDRRSLISTTINNPSQSNNMSSNSDNNSNGRLKLKLPALLPETNEDDEESYFGDILDKYCNSDDDVTSPATASPTSPFSSAPGWKELKTAQPPTPPVSRSYRSHKDTASPSRRTGLTTSTGTETLQSTATDGQALDNGTRYTRSRNHSTSDTASSAVSPMNAATAKFNNMYLQSSSNRDSRESLSRSSVTSSPLLATAQLSSSSSGGSSSSLVARSYVKRPAPLPNDAPSSSAVPISSSQPIPSRPSLTSMSTQESTRESRPEPPPKDSSRRHYNNSHGGSNGTSSNSSSNQPPFLSFDAQPQGQLANHFASIVEATMMRHKASASISSNTSGTYNSNVDPYYQPPLQPQPSSRTKTSTGYSVSSSQSSQSGNGYTQEKPQTHRSSSDSHIQQQHRYPEGQGHHDRSQQSSHAQGSHSSGRSSHTTSHRQLLHNDHHQPNSTPNPYQDDTQYRNHGGSMSQLDLLSSMQKPSSSSTTLPYVSERSRSYSYGSVSAPSSSRPGQGGYGRVLKPAILKTPIARARAKEMHGPRKVNFGEMITIVTIERAETPPPLPVIDKKQKKKQLQQAKKNASNKDGQQNFDPEYNAEYYNTPYTPVPAEVVVTLAPWIGNPNYDEEKQNSKFYYDDDYEYDEDEYENPYESDIRLGPESDDDEDEDEEDDDDDDEEGGSRVWGSGIAGGGGSFPKKKGGMFKFKRAVNRLLRN